MRVARCTFTPTTPKGVKVLLKEARLEEIHTGGVPHVAGLAVLQPDVSTRLQLQYKPASAFVHVNARGNKNMLLRGKQEW